MNTIKTAEEFCNKGLGFEQYPTDTPYFMIEFAKLHVEAALEAANNKVNYAMEEFGAVFPDTVLNVYPLNNIK